MAVYEGTERRRAGRTKLVTFCPTVISHAKKNHDAMMTDVSALGAGFRLDKTGREVTFKPGDALEATVRTPYGPSKCTCRVVWCRVEEDVCTCGVQFTVLSQDTKDPLRCLMESPF